MIESSPSTTEPSENNLARKTIHGIGWNYLAYGLGKLLSLATTAILARLLAPENFGLVAYVTVAITYLTIIKDLGLGAALIQRREDLEKASHTVFTLNLMVGLALTGISALAAPFVAAYFREPLVIPMLRWLGLTIFINSLGSVHMSRLQRDLKFHWRLIPLMGNILVKAAVSITLALMDYGAWALIFGQIAGSVVSVILVWMVVPWRPRLMLDKKMASKLFKFGSFIMVEDALSVAQENFDYLIVGRMFNQVSMGIYTLAYQLPEMLVITLFWVIGEVIFPAFSSIQNQPEKLKKSLLYTIRYIELVVTPLCLGLIVTADPLIRVIFGEKWLGVIPIMQILSLYALVLSIGFNMGDVYKAIGRPDILIKITLSTMVFRIFALWYGAQFGLIYVAVGHLAAAFIEVIIRLTVATRILHITFKEIISQLTAFIGGGILLLVTVPLLYFTQETQPILRLVVLAAAGAISYAGSMWIIEREALIKVLSMAGIGTAKTPEQD